MEQQPLSKADYLIDEFEPELAADIYNVIAERAMLGLLMGVLTLEEAMSHIDAAKEYFLADTERQRVWGKQAPFQK